MKFLEANLPPELSTRSRNKIGMRHSGQGRKKYFDSYTCAEP